MEPFTLMTVPGLIGGLVIALFLARTKRRRSADSIAVAIRPDAPESAVINAARIRVAGVGGLGLVAMALLVAWWVPRIGLTLAAGFVLGLALAVVLIARRRSSGPMPSSGQALGANTILSIDHPRLPDRRDDTPTPRLQVANPSARLATRAATH
jgi:hypothetical protein